MKKSDTGSTILAVLLLIVGVYIAYRLIRIVLGLLSVAVFSLVPILWLCFYAVVIYFVVKFAIQLFKK
jgi:hypothetical protein